MRSAFKNALVLFFTAVLVCGLFAIAEYIARRNAYRRFGAPNRESELILDRWTAFRNNPYYRGNGVQLNAQGFRRDLDVPLTKQPNGIRIFLLGGSVAYGGETLYPEIDDQWRINNQTTIDYYLERRLNSSFPEKHWEVINAAVKGSLLNQDLANFLSRLQRYKPDCLILLDGVNDVFAMLRFPESEDGYSSAGLGEQFDGLTQPGSMSLKLMASTWLLNNSALYRSITESVAQRRRIRARRERARTVPDNRNPDLASLTPNEQQQFQIAASHISNYLHPVWQIHRVAMLEGTQVVFALQPQIALSQKPLTRTEGRLFDYWSRLDGPLFVYGFEKLYPEISRFLLAGAQKEDYRFLDLTHTFDRMDSQTFTDYCHLTPAGNQAIANALFDSLASLSLSETRQTR